MEQEDTLNENNVPDWADLVRAFSKMQTDFTGPLRSADILSSPPVPNLDELTWSNTYLALFAHRNIQARLLQEMQKVEARISFLQMSCNKLALRRGFRFLPDEILAIIFEMGCTSDLDGNRFAVTISHVNRRFRNISLQIPRLWSTITNRQGVSELEEFFIRSKNTGIRVRLLQNLAQSYSHAPSLSPIVLGHSEQWFDFEYAIYREIESGSELFNCLRHLPNLRRLTDCSGYLRHALSNSVMPSLVDYEGELSPSPGFSATALVSCTLHLWEFDDTDVLRRLLSFLSNNPNLRSLTLIFHEWIPYGDTNQADPQVTLSSLETFSIHFSGGCFIDDRVERFMTNLNLPNITQLSVRVLTEPSRDTLEYSDTDRFSQALFPGLNPYPTLDKLDLIMDSFYYIPSKELEDILGKLPCLRRLYVEVPRLCPPFITRTWPSLPPLHSVELSRCDYIGPEFVESFVNGFLRNEHSAEDRIQTFTIAKCRGLSRSSFRHIEGKLGDRFVFLPEM